MNSRWISRVRPEACLFRTGLGPRPAPAEGESTVITGEGVLQALVLGKLGAEQALQTGLIQVLAPAPQRERLARALRQAFPHPPLAAR